MSILPMCPGRRSNGFRPCCWIIRVMRTFGDLAWRPVSRWRPDAMQPLLIFIPEPIFGPDHQKCVRSDNYAEYDRNKTRGILRPGTALLHGMLYCGECGHKLVVQYKGRTRYICNYLRQQYRVPVCQYIPADPIDQAVVRAFWEALAPVELDAYAQAVAME